MKHVPTAVSVMVLIWAVAAILRVPGRDLTWTVPGYVMTQCLFVLVAWWGLQRSAVNSTEYRTFFAFGFFFVLLMAMIATGRFLAVFPSVLGMVVIFGTIGSACTTAAVVYWRLEIIYREGVPAVLQSTVAQATILSFCGSATLLTLFADLKPAFRIAASALGAFWFLLGGFFFAYCVGILRMYGPWARLNQYVPMMLAIAAFAWMAFQLSTMQREAAPEAVAQHVLHGAAR